MNNFIDDIRFILMPSRHPTKGYENIYVQAYQVWRNAWEKFYRESNVTGPLSSDPFILPDEIGVLMYQNLVVGLAAYTHGDLSAGTLPDHSWFKPWTPEAFIKLKAISTDCMVCSQFTISPDFAGRGHIVRWKEILFYYNHLRLINSIKSVMAGHLNLSRGMQNAGGEEYGGIILNSNCEFSFHGTTLDSQLVAYTRESIQAMVDRKELTTMFENLWGRLENLSQFSVSSKISNLKKVA